MSTKVASEELPIRSLTKYGFPQGVVDVLEERKFASLNPIQRLAVAKGLFEGRNLIIAAPTSSGKTLCAELAAVQHALNAKGAFYLVSLKALAEEKYELFRRFWTQGHEPIMRVGITTGDREFDDENLSQCKVTFATYEKFYSILKENPGLLKHISLVVVDEVQTLGERVRGLTLETLMTTVRVQNPSIQMLGLSAALANPEDIAKWVQADVCRITGRDIPLTEEVWTASTVYSKVFGVGQTDLNERSNPTGSTDTLKIVHHLLAEKKTPIVVFCMTKQRAEELARTHREATRKSTSVIRKGVQQLKQLLLFVSEGGPTGRSLVEVVEGEIAFHHSDLSMEERQVLEAKIREGDILVTYSTTTLGQGVNLPIAVVVFDDVYRRWLDSYIDQREYINMAGRAGRRGLKDAGGTSILLCRSAKDRQRMNDYLSERVEPVVSALEDTSLPFLALNLVASQVAATVDEVQTFLRQSLFGTASQEKNPALLAARIEAVQRVLGKLEDDGFLFQPKQGKYRATDKGRITAQKNIEPETATRIIERLKVVADFVAGKKERSLLSPVLHAFLECQTEAGLLYWDYRAKEFLYDQREAICCIRRFEHPDNPDATLMTAWVLSEWTRGSAYNKICGPFRNLREGNIRGSADHLAWMLDAAVAFARLPQLKISPPLGHFLSMLRKRLLYGVAEGGVPLMEVVRNHSSVGVPLSGIGRGKVQALVEQGLDDLTKVLEASDSDLVKTIKENEQVQNLKQAIVKYLEVSSLSLFPEHVRRGERVSTKSAVEAVYKSMGTDFEVAVYNLLRSISLSVKLLDDKKIQGCADLLIETQGGNIQIECKTSKRGQVSNTDAFEVLGKTQVGEKPTAFVTVGKPSFVATAIQNSFNNGVTLITNKVIVEAILQVLEGRRTKGEFLSLLCSGHHLETVELR
ncbi:MAG TPA: DEAD/DEAH box helicase [Candidatus Acidoferrales bacterium]|nr:DEAD/DEAH box helicase [Candidatus Acidoferrales bacterium]